MWKTRVPSWMPKMPDGAQRLATWRLFLLADLALVLVLSAIWLQSDWPNLVFFAIILTAFSLAYFTLYRRESSWVDELSELNEDLRRALAESDTLAEISKEFSGEIQLSALFDLMARRSRELLGGDYASVAIAEENTVDTIWVAGDGVRSDSLLTMRREPGKGFVGQAMCTGEPLIIEDFGDNPAFPLANHTFHIAEGMVAALVMPMSRGMRSFGAITVGFRRPHVFGDQQIAFLEAIAAQAGIAMDNAQLYSEEKRRVAELEAVLDHMSEGVIVTDSSGLVVRC
ncbi:MAG: GAF domain-containing protein, partial [Planctomycetaceae bacterium]